jgi:hypothetical protein
VDHRREEGEEEESAEQSGGGGGHGHVGGCCLSGCHCSIGSRPFVDSFIMKGVLYI